MHNLVRRILVGTVILPCAAAVTLRADDARSRAAVERLISGSGADVAVAFRTLDPPEGPAPRPFVLVVLVRGIADGARSSALIAQIARVLFDEAQAAIFAPPGPQGP